MSTQTDSVRVEVPRKRARRFNRQLHRSTWIGKLGTGSSVRQGPCSRSSCSFSAEPRSTGATSVRTTCVTDSHRRTSRSRQPTPWTISTIAVYAGYAMVIAGLLLGLLAFLGFRHAKRAAPINATT